MSLHPETFGYLAPTDVQRATMEEARHHAAAYVAAIDPLIPDGPDKTYLLRKFREVAMWVNISVTRMPDGLPRG